MVCGSKKFSVYFKVTRPWTGISSGKARGLCGDVVMNEILGEVEKVIARLTEKIGFKTVAQRSTRA